MDAAGTGAAGVMACAQRLDMEFLRQPAVAGKADQSFIRPRAVPPFNACGRALEAVNRLAFRAQAARSARRPWTRFGALLVEACAAAPDRRECIALAPETRPGGPQHSPP